jgi:hypothetical protein
MRPRTDGRNTADVNLSALENSRVSIIYDEWDSGRPTRQIVELSCISRPLGWRGRWLAFQPLIRRIIRFNRSVEETPTRSFQEPDRPLHQNNLLRKLSD